MLKLKRNSDVKKDLNAVIGEMANQFARQHPHYQMACKCIKTEQMFWNLINEKKILGKLNDENWQVGLLIYTALAGNRLEAQTDILGDVLNSIAKNGYAPNHFVFEQNMMAAVSKIYKVDGAPEAYADTFFISPVASDGYDNICGFYSRPNRIIYVLNNRESEIKANSVSKITNIDHDWIGLGIAHEHGHAELHSRGPGQWLDSAIFWAVGFNKKINDEIDGLLSSLDEAYAYLYSAIRKPRDFAVKYTGDSISRRNYDKKFDGHFDALDRIIGNLGAPTGSALLSAPERMARELADFFKDKKGEMESLLENFALQLYEGEMRALFAHLEPFGAIYDKIRRTKKGAREFLDNYTPKLNAELANVIYGLEKIEQALRTLEEYDKIIRQ